MHASNTAPCQTPLYFDDIEPAVALGTHIDVYDQTMSDRWCYIYAVDAGSHAEQASISLVLAMRALLSVVVPRPPGNVHARQRMTLCALPVLGEMVRSEVTCIRKEIKRERRYVDFAVKGFGEDGRSLYEAEMSIIWAA